MVVMVVDSGQLTLRTLNGLPAILILKYPIAGSGGFDSFSFSAVPGLCHFAGFVLGAEAVATHLALAVAGHSVRVQRQQRALKMLAGSAQFAQGDLQSLGLLKGMGFQQVVDSQVSGDKGQAVG